MSLDHLIAQSGGDVSGFLDINGDTQMEDQRSALELMEFDERVKCVLVNIFCSSFETMSFIRALQYVKEHGTLKKPIVIRLKGTDEEEARQLIKELKWKEILETGKQRIFLCDGLDDAAMVAVKIAKDYDSGVDMKIGTSLGASKGVEEL